jgi:2'-5' RNA ligase
LTDRARLFVALDLPGDVRSALVDWRRGALAGIEGLRLLAPRSLHVTLCFLGWRGADEVDQIAAACAGAVERSIGGLSLGNAMWLPERGRPRVAAVAILDASGAISSLQSSLAGALSAGGWYAREKRPFVAHVTVARAGRGARVRRDEIGAPPEMSFTASTVTLYRSLLSASGARYESLRAFPLGRDAAGTESIRASPSSSRGA